MTTVGDARVVSLGAGGTLSRPADIEHPDSGRKWRLLTEIVLIFVAAPLVIRFAVFELRVPLFMVLPPIFIGFIGYLLWDRTFAVGRELSRGMRARHVVWIAAIFFAAGGAVAYAVATVMPERFLSFPIERPMLWQFVIVAYPFLSVIPQELLYRTFFFHRYGPLFGDRRLLAIGVNGVLFGFAHVLVNNWLAVGATAVTGLLFAFRYATTRSFWAVTLEHTLWGWLVFTVGLGSFFFTGVAPPRW
jgi:hypothetical protein